ncbi:hypothetical protein [Erythrobacter sp.]|uniref:hypothetical protein n=1 Tax=Erythrobacter sp. TaxID=1042 RepID=UPI001425E3F8|nr:hypothetical protein [Erythrobacter sp.]QIQ87525.1 MAG: hypothetical protein G9473_13170 [Erythrobacter sp.]
MSADHLTRRNRANAKKSTGPRTARGKARVAGNARKHGATAQPDPQRVASWLAIILDRPEISGQDFTPADDRGYRALALAQAEARLNAAEQALRDLEKQHTATSRREELSFDQYVEEVVGGVGSRGPQAQERRGGLQVRLRHTVEHPGRGEARAAPAA